MKQDRFSLSQIFPQNPILQESLEYKNLYIAKLKEYILLLGRENEKFEKAELQFYQKIIMQSHNGTRKHEFSYYRYFLLIDEILCLGCKLTESEAKILMQQYRRDFTLNREGSRTANALVKSFTRSPARLEELMKHPELQQERKYLQLLNRNSQFQNKKPYRVLVTATMSAGKSTFINALTGKEICQSQNMACTSKIHTIINKAFEDDLAYEYDHNLVLTACEEELMNDNEENTSDRITVAVRFNSALQNTRIVISDSPGVNFSGAAEHREITQEMIRTKNYDLLIYVMNATQLATTDEEEHLAFVRQFVGNTPVLFVLNKVDELNPEKEEVAEIFQNMKNYLELHGFHKPLICPVSSQAGWMAKRELQGELNETEQWKLWAYMGRFQTMNLPEYYATEFPRARVDCNTEQEQLLRTSGFAYIEKIIMLRSARRN